MTTPCGFTLQPDRAFLELVAGIVRDADYVEIAPETTWFVDGDGAFAPNGFWRAWAALVERGKPAVAHGVGLSMGSAGRSEGRRRRRWYDRLAADQATFRYRWYTDHLGASVLAGEAVGLPLPLPMDGRTAAVVRRRLAEMRRVAPDVGFENTCQYFVLGDPMDEPAFFADVLRGGGWLLLDLHNVHTMAKNLGFDAREYVDRLPLDRVIEIHVSGGAESDPRWLPEGRVVRLDGHDGPVPDDVWRLLERALPRCPALRGVTLERMEGTVDAATMPALTAEWRRLREMCR